MHTIILSGGSGIRLWPLSTKKCPKQFLKLTGEQTLLQQTYARHQGISEQISFVCGPSHVPYIEEQIDTPHCIIEPKAKNTLPAIALALCHLREKNNLKKDDPILITPSDHAIAPLDLYQEALYHAQDKASQGLLVLFGIKPSSPHTGYGYIEVDASYSVLAFKEKPSLGLAKSYIKQGNYYWNSGIVCASAASLEKTIETYAPKLFAHMQQGTRHLLDQFSTLDSLSFDCTILEKCKNSTMVPLHCSWSDMGSYTSLYEHKHRDSDNNVLEGKVESHNSHNNLILGSTKPIVIRNIDNLIVVDSEEGLLITTKDPL